MINKLHKLFYFIIQFSWSSLIETMKFIPQFTNKISSSITRNSLISKDSSIADSCQFFSFSLLGNFSKFFTWGLFVFRRNSQTVPTCQSYFLRSNYQHAVRKILDEWSRAFPNKEEVICPPSKCGSFCRSPFGRFISNN